MLWKYVTANELGEDLLDYKEDDSMSLAKIVSKNIKALRQKAGLSQQKLADNTKLTVRYISRLENSSPNVTLDIIERLAQGLGVSPEEILADPKRKGLKGTKTLSKSVDDAIQTLNSIKTMIGE